MRLLLTQNLVYVPTLGGANKSNRLLMESFARLGHRCVVVGPATGLQASAGGRPAIEELEARGISIERHAGRAIVFELNGVEVHAVTDSSELRAYVRHVIATFDPTWALVSSEDPGQNLLEASLAVCPGRVVYLARTTMALPCGPEAAAPSAHGMRLLQNAAAVVTISGYMREYLKEWAGVEAVCLPICPNEPGPFPNFARFESGYLTLINPCALKGISIFVELADTFREWTFAAVPTWGATPQDLEILRCRPNIVILEPSDRIDAILRLSRAVLVPSLWAEAKGRVIIESMLHGLPVLASNVGGIAEAKLGIDYLLPVNPITRYEPGLDERLLPVAEVPPQPVHLWADALRDLFSCKARYDEVANASRQAANAVVDEGAKPLEAYLSRLRPSAVSSRTMLVNNLPQPPSAVPAGGTHLSREKRSLLAIRFAARRQEGVHE